MIPPPIKSGVKLLKTQVGIGPALYSCLVTAARTWVRMPWSFQCAAENVPAGAATNNGVRFRRI